MGSSSTNGPGARWGPRAGAVAVALLGAACGGGPSPARSADHVLLIVIDTLRADHVGCYGYPRDTTPHLDALAARGVRFAEAYSQSSWTAPSMVSLFTGRYVAQRCMQIPDEHATLVEAFDERGFETAAFVTNDLVSPENGFDRGFDHYTERRSFLGDASIASWIATCAGRDTFTYVHLQDPHDPYSPPKGFHTGRERRAVVSEAQWAYYAEASRRLGLTGLDESILHIRRELRRYDDEVTCADHQVGEILAAYEAAGILDRTVVVVTADHGEGLWTHEVPYRRFTAEKNGEPLTIVRTFKHGHGNEVFQELIHVPLILAGGGLPEGVVVEPPVENVDIAPTLFELFGFPFDGALQGTSLVRALGGEGSWRKGHAFSSTHVESTVVTRDGFKLVVPRQVELRPHHQSVRLYDLNDDPLELHDVARDHPERVAELMRLVRERLDIGLKIDPEEHRAQFETNHAKLRRLGYVEGGWDEWERGADDEGRGPRASHPGPAAEGPAADGD